MYKFVDLPYNYKPIKNLYDSGILERENDVQTKEKQETSSGRQETFSGRQEAFQLISHQSYINSTTVPEFKTPQEPIRSQHVIHVSPIANGCHCNGVNRGVRHISVPVIMTCGHPSALPRKTVSTDGQALA